MIKVTVVRQGARGFSTSTEKFSTRREANRFVEEARPSTRQRIGLDYIIHVAK